MEYISPFVNVIGKTITMYVGSIPMSGDELIIYKRLMTELPPKPDCGIVTSIWSNYYPQAAMLGTMIGLRDMSTPNSVEVLIPINEFDMRNVPWDKLNPRSGCA